MGNQIPAGLQVRDDPLERSPSESPAHEVELAPYFVSRYELTQG